MAAPSASSQCVGLLDSLWGKYSVIPGGGESVDTLCKLKSYLKSKAAAYFFIAAPLNFASRSQMRIFTAGFQPLSFCLSYCLKLLGCYCKPSLLDLVLLSFTAVV